MALLVKYALVLVFVFATPMAEACTISHRTKAEERQRNNERRLASKPVSQGKYCEFKDAGIYDNLRGFGSTKLDHGRVYQVLPTVGLNAMRITDVLVADCNNREVVRITSLVLPKYKNTYTCGGILAEAYDLLKPEGELTLNEGNNLSELIEIAQNSGKFSADEELNKFFKDSLGKRVPSKDRFDLLCGCKLHYPNSKGAAS